MLFLYVPQLPLPLACARSWSTSGPRKEASTRHTSTQVCAYIALMHCRFNLPALHDVPVPQCLCCFCCQGFKALSAALAHTHGAHHAALMAVTWRLISKSTLSMQLQRTSHQTFCDFPQKPHLTTEGCDARYQIGSTDVSFEAALGSCLA